MIDFGRLRFFLSEVLRNFTRNTMMQVTAIGTVAVTILVLGLFLYARESIAYIGNDIVGKIEISVYVKDGADTKALQTQIRKDPRVRRVTLVSKSAGLRQMRERFKGQIDTSLLTANPLPDKLRVEARRPESVPALATSVRRLAGVADVNYAQDAVERMLRVAEIFSRVGIVLVGLLIFVAAIIISNTIRLTVFARRREIAIMQLVGATSAYIRGPFICEGFVAGVLGAAVALGVLSIARSSLLPKLIVALPFLPLGAATVNDAVFAIELLGIGGIVGILAAWMSVGRYLRT